MSRNERFENPVDKKSYMAEGGWKAYEPDEPRKPEDTGRIHTVGVRLLTAESDIAERTSVDSLADFATLAEAAAQDALNDVTATATVMVQFSCTPEKHTVQLAHQGQITQDQLQSFYDQLVALKPMQVSAGEVSFQLTIQVNPLAEK